MSEDDLERRRRLLGPAYRLLYAEPLRPVRGEGVWMIEADGRRALDVLRDEGLMARAAAVGDRLRGLLAALAARHPALGAVRGAGLYLGVEVAAGPAAAACLVEGMRRRGVLVGLCGPAADVVKIRPPLVFGADHADLLADCMDAALSADGP